MVSLTAREGDVVAIIGGSGSGKSTMLRCINFLETPSGGEIEIGGEHVAMRPDGHPIDKRQIERLRQSLGNLGIAEADYAPIAAYAVKVYGDGHQLDALGPLPAAEIVSIFKATEPQAHALRQRADANSPGRV